MSWLSNPLKYAGDLLDSVDRKADNALEKGVCMHYISLTRAGVRFSLLPSSVQGVAVAV